MEFTWTNPTLNTIPAEGHYIVGDFNCTLFTVTEKDYIPAHWDLK